MSKYLYSIDDKFDPEWVNVYYTYADYDLAAEEIAERTDCQCAEYPDEQVIWLMREGDILPRRFKVYAEHRRHYSASEIK